MLRAPLVSSLLLLSACGGGGGSPSAVSTPIRLSAAALEVAPTATSAELVVQLSEAPAPAPVLIEVAIELPPGLVLTEDPLQAAQPAPTLDGGLVDGRYRVVCGDARNKSALPLQVGPLFRMRVTTAVPRQVGTYSITLRNLRAAQSNGEAVAVDPNPTVVSVTVR